MLRTEKPLTKMNVFLGASLNPHLYRWVVSLSLIIYRRSVEIYGIARSSRSSVPSRLPVKLMRQAAALREIRQAIFCSASSHRGVGCFEKNMGCIVHCSIHSRRTLNYRINAMKTFSIWKRWYLKPPAKKNAPICNNASKMCPAQLINITNHQLIQ